MKLSTILRYAGTREAADEVVEWEAAGLDTVWVAESYGFDSPTVMGYLAARTRTIEIGSAILNVFSRTPAVIAQTAAGLDALSGGRALIGLGVSIPALVEGFHGVPYSLPLTRTREVVDVVRMALRREKVTYRGKTVNVPLVGGPDSRRGRPLTLLNRPVRDAVPLYVGAAGPRSVEAVATWADGWLPYLFDPEGSAAAWGASLAEGGASRSTDLAPLEICAGGLLRIGEDTSGVLDALRPGYARHIGAMGGDPGPYHQAVSAYGFAEQADEIRTLYREGLIHEAEAKVPAELLERCNLVGPASWVQERIAAFREAGVTNLLLEPAGENFADAVARVKEWTS